VVLTRLQGWLAALVVLLGTGALVALDLTDARFRAWCAARALATDVFAGLLVLLVTLLVVDQLVRRRELGERERVVGAQGAIVMAQATRAGDAIEAVLGGSGDREVAAGELRTYMMMLLVVAPVLIDTRAPRAFLEQAQVLGGEMARALNLKSATEGDRASTRARLDTARATLRTAAAPLLETLDLERFRS
jgi:hypothetical protein